MQKKLYFWKIYGLKKIKGHRELQSYNIVESQFDTIFNAIKTLPFDKKIVNKKSRYFKDSCNQTWQIRFVNELLPKYQYTKTYEFFLFGKWDTGMLPSVDTSKTVTPLSLRADDDLLLGTLGLIDKKKGIVAVIIDDKNRGIKNFARYIQDRFNYLNKKNTIRIESEIIPVRNIEQVLKTITDINSIEFLLDNTLSDNEIEIFNESGLDFAYNIVKTKQNDAVKTIRASIRLEEDLTIQKGVKKGLLSIVKKGIAWTRNKNMKVAGKDNNGDNHFVSFLETKLCEHVNVTINNKKVIYSEAFNEIKDAYEEHFA